MSSCSESPAIHRLNFDILWRIFDINADVFEDRRALDTTLATSRVCRDWRVILLSSTSLWAHVVDLDNRVWNTVEGSREMIRRTGTALLWIQTHSLNPYRRGIKAVWNAIDTNWERIQKLDVEVYSQFVHHWKALSRPAPHLTFFDVVFGDDSLKINNFLPSLFGGSAPMLRHFRLRCGSTGRLYIAAFPWFQQLRSMDLNAQLSLSQTLSVLMLTTNLTNLRLDYMWEDHAPLELSPVSLPKLALLDLDFAYKLTQGTAFLEHICIPPIVLSQILCVSHTTGRDRQEKHFQDYYWCHIYQREASLRSPSTQTTARHNHTLLLSTQGHILL